MTSLAGLIHSADHVLRGEAAPRSGSRAGEPMISTLALMILVYGIFYGGVMGTYGGVAGPRFWQVVYSAVKVPLLLLATFALSLPSFFVINTLLGLRGDFPYVLRALLSTQAGLTVILSALAPFTAFWYVSGSGYESAILFNGAMFAVASVSAQWMLRRSYEPLVRSNERHRWMLRAWLIIYVFVGIQMGWVLRPFIGNPDAPVQFFREGSWTNAYEALSQIVWQAFFAHRRS
jgi:hypothetical protein